MRKRWPTYQASLATETSSATRSGEARSAPFSTLGTLGGDRTLPINSMVVHPRQRFFGDDMAKHKGQQEIAQHTTDWPGGLVAAAPCALRDDPLDTTAPQLFEGGKCRRDVRSIAQAFGDEDPVLDRHGRTL